MGLGEKFLKLLPSESHVSLGEALRIWQEHRRAALHRHVAMRDRSLERQAGRKLVGLNRIGCQLIGVHEAQMVVPVCRLRRTAGIHPVDLCG